MHNYDANSYLESGAGVAQKFLNAIDGGDTLTFWNLLDSKGKGYFLGMWFFALGNADLGSVSMLAEDENFLKDALAQIVGELRNNLELLLDNPELGKLHYVDSQHALVPVTAYRGEDEGTLTDYIPLVLELSPTVGRDDAGSFGKESIGMTCWKIDTLKCFSVKKI